MKVGGKDESKKIFLRPENESSRSFFEIWPLDFRFSLFA
jgi:hypothetical protein